MLRLIPSGQACGATVTGVDLRRLDDALVAAIRTAWLEHHVLAFVDQDLENHDLERFTLALGGFGIDPFIRPIAGSDHVVAIKRTAQETSPLFAENWHSDWSFQQRPPSGTCLYAITIPPIGGDTLFANQHAALEAMPTELRLKLTGRLAIHSARNGYAPSGMYGADDARDRSMDIIHSPEAEATQLHPVIRRHPETGREGIFGCAGYIIGFEDMDEEEGRELVMELHAWQTREEFQYRHRWAEGTLLLWDNRSVLHRATGGYDGHDRLLHRTTIAAV